MGLIVVVNATSEHFGMARALADLQEAGFSFEDGEGRITFNATVDDYEPISVAAEEALGAIAAAYEENGFIHFAVKGPFSEESRWLVTVSHLDWSFQTGMGWRAYDPQLLDWAISEIDSFFRIAGISYQIWDSDVF